MPERRPFPPSPRRLALARAAGLTAASPLLVGAAAAIAMVAALFGLGRAAAAKVGAWIAAASGAAGAPDVVASDAADARDVVASDAAGALAATANAGDIVAGGAGTGTIVASPAAGPDHVVATGAAGAVDSHAASALTIDALARAVLELALPLLAAAAIVAIGVHLAQTRTLWLPRRRIAGAPQLGRHELTRIAFDMLGATVVGSVVVGWLWLSARQLANLVYMPSAAGSAIASLLVALTIAWLALAVIDVLVRRAQLAEALAMSREEKREDDRLAAADPRWRAQRLAVLRGPATPDAVARAAVVLLGDDVAVAIDWDPVRQPVPLRVATGRRARATQLVGLARRHRVAVHRDAELAGRLASSEGAVPEADWPRLADIVAAVRGR